jgi:tetratricopeptide (TPR) repeat protein
VAGEDAPVDPIGLQNLGSLLESVGDYVGAVATMTEATRLMRTRFPEDSPAVLKADANLARALAFAGRHAEARALFERVRAVHAAAGESSRFEWALETFRQAGAERIAGHFDVASRLLAEAEAVLVPMVPEDHPLMAQIHRQRGMLAAAMGDLPAAHAELKKARAIIERAKLSALDRALVDVPLAAVARAAGDPTRARELLSAALPVLRANVGPNEYYRAAAERLDAELAKSPASH